MAIPRPLLLILTLHLITTTTITSTIAASSFDLNWINNIQSTCRGSIAECLSDSDDDEFMLDSEINRRVLAAGIKYISYTAMCKDCVPCSHPGASYYDCGPGASGKPYSRPCVRISMCRGRG